MVHANTNEKQQAYANPRALVETAWVAAHGADPTVRLVEVDVDTSAYETGHIPGAIGWDWQIDLQQRPVRDLPTRQEWEALLSRSGIGNASHVLLYGDHHNWFAAFAYWLFKVYGHERVSLIDGGRAKWLAEGRPVTTAIPTVIPGAYHADTPNLALRAFRDQVMRAIDLRDHHLIDVRSPQEYSGELLAPEHLPQEGAQRGGHIPGAVNIPWASAVNADSTFKSTAELAAIYAANGHGELPTIAYCRIGERSAHTWFVLHELLGHPDVRNYDGSWTEWGSLIGAPIER